MDEIGICINATSEKCEKKPYCTTITEDKICKLCIPEKNLISRVINPKNPEAWADNETIYYGKISDELIRYIKMRNYIFNPQTFLSLPDIEYNTDQNELILLNTLLEGDYFDDIEEKATNIYETNNTLEFNEPRKSKIYLDKYDLLKQIKILEPTECINESKHLILKLPGGNMGVFRHTKI